MILFITILYVAIGGAIGSVLRYVGVSVTHMIWGSSFPLGVLLVNAIGAFAIGFLDSSLLKVGTIAHEWRAFWMVGVLGGFTTFSSFSLDTLILLDEGHILNAAMNVVLNVILCLVLAGLGMYYGRYL